MVILITYDLKQPGRDYSTLYEAIKSYGNWAHPVESVWLVDTIKTPAGIRDHLKKCIDTNDMLLVVQLNLNWASWGLSSSIIEWLKNTNRSW